MPTSTRLTIILLLLGVLALASCASMFQQPKDIWIGQTKDQLQVRKGVPGSKTTDGHGGELWVYLDEVRRWSYGKTTHGWAEVMTDYLLVSQYYIDAHGIIYLHRESPR
jgi:hypothetical protein